MSHGDILGHRQPPTKVQTVQSETPPADAKSHHRSQLRLPVEVAERLKKKASANRRSLNSEVTLRLERSLEQEQAGAAQ